MNCGLCGKKLGGFWNKLLMNYTSECHRIHTGTHHICFYNNKDKEYKEFIK